MHTSKPYSTGFTLIELLLTLTILALTAGVVAPHAVDSTRSLAAEEAARTFHRRLQHAQTLANARGRPVRVLLEVGAGRYRFDTPAGPGRAADTGVLGSAHRLPPSIAVEVVEGFSSGRMMLSPSGPAAPGRIVLSGPDDHFVIRIESRRGRIVLNRHGRRHFR